MKFVDLMGGTCESAFMYYNKFMKKHGERFAIVKRDTVVNGGNYKEVLIR